MFAWLLFTAAVCILLGIILTLWVEWTLFSQPVKPNSTENNNEDNLFQTDCPIELPLELLDELERLVNRTSSAAAASGTTSKGDQTDGRRQAQNEEGETLLAVNLLVQYFFRELCSQGRVRRWLLQRINLEMQEVLTRGAVSKIIKGLKIYDIEMGSRAPTIQKIGVHNVNLDGEKQNMESIGFDLSIDYSGGFGIAIDVALAYGKSAFLSAKVARLKGPVRLSFSRQPYSHWSIAFSSTPHLDVDVTSRVQGRSFSHVTSLVAAQIHKWIQRRHTLPTSRMRHRPFYPLPDHALLPGTGPQTATLPVRRGSLEVTVLEVTRLNPLLHGDGLYATMALDSCPWINAVASDTEGKVTLDIRMVHKRYKSLGIQFQQPSSNDSTPMDETAKEIKINSGVIIIDVEPDSSAEEAGLRPGDTIQQIDDIPVRSADDFLRVVSKSKELFFIVRVERRPSKKIGSMMRLDTITPSPTFDVLDEKSLTGAEEISGSLLTATNTALGYLGFKHSTLDIKRTASYPLNKVVRFRDTIKFQVMPGQRFLNLSVWLTGVPVIDEGTSGKTVGKTFLPASPSKAAAATSNLSNLFKKHSSPRIVPAESNLPHQETTAKETAKEANHAKEYKDVVVGHVNISLPEVAADCHLNTQGHHISTYQLYPADVKAALGRQNQLSQQLGFDPRLCYGDIVLSFVYRPDQRADANPGDADLDTADLVYSRSPSPLPPLAAPSPPPIELARPAVDIVINDAKQLHDFTLTQFVQVRQCDFCRKKIWLREALQCKNCELVCHKKCIKRFPDRKWCDLDGFIEIANIPIATDISKTDLDENPFLMMDEEGDEETELELAVERIQLREHNDSLIRLAKECGKELYINLSNDQRRTRINSMLRRLEAVTEIETVRRYELFSKMEGAEGPPCSSEERKRLKKEADACESRRQALVLLLLYYSSGLQSVEEAELTESGSFKHCDN